MKQIFGNRFVKAISFRTYEEWAYFSNNHSSVKNLWLESSDGEYYISYVFCDSLTKRPFFILSFCCESMESELNLMLWDKSKLIVVETDTQIHLVNEEPSVIASLDVTSSIIGFHLTQANNLLILEEAYLRLIDFEGKILIRELFDLAEDYTLEGNMLIIKTAEERKRINLDDYSSFRNE
jgi:hypothetical protein